MELRKHKKGILLFILAVCLCAVALAIYCQKNTANVAYAESDDSQIYSEIPDGVKLVYKVETWYTYANINYRLHYEGVDVTDTEVKHFISNGKEITTFILGGKGFGLYQLWGNGQNGTYYYYAKEETYVREKVTLDFGKNSTSIANAEFVIYYNDLDCTEELAEKTDTFYGTKIWGASIGKKGGGKYTIVDNAGFFPTRTFYYRSFKKNDESIECLPNSWWEVSLPNYCGDASGTYSLSSETEALQFARDAEWFYRVKTLPNGAWTYRNIGNESVVQVYYNRKELEAAVEHYAKTLVKDRRVMKPNTTEIPKPVRSKSGGSLMNKYECYQPTTDYLGAVFDSLEGKRSLLSSKDYIWKSEKDYGGTITMTLRYVGDKTASGYDAFELHADESIDIAMKRRFGEVFQGYYEITESNNNDAERVRYVYLDFTAPSLEVNNGTMSFTIDSRYVTQYGDVLRYKKLELKKLVDKDSFGCAIYISGLNLDSRYISTDELPVLSYENGYYGKYDISLYDRSGNTLDFSVMIAGAPPTVEHTSLVNDKQCTLIINVGDSNNALTSLKLYKVLYTGERMQLTTDDDGTAVGIGNYQYVLRNGGKYVVEMTDVYGRSVKTEPIFYLKGLPSGTLKGVPENGTTNKDVSLTFSDDAAVILYIWNGSAWAQTGGLEIMRGNGIVTATLPASKVTGDKRFKFFLYNAAERNLFVEYEFRMKCVLPEVEIRSVSGSTITQNAVTRDSFMIEWTQDDLSVEYYRADSALGEMNATSYQKGALIVGSAVWRFHVTDSVGNTLDFDVTLDNEVNYNLDGNYEMFGTEYVSKYWLTLTVAEDVRTFRVTSSNGLPVTNGQKLTQDGIYQYFIEDLNGNVEELTLIVDKTPPVPVIRTEAGVELSPNARTNRPFTVACEEADVTISYAFDNGGTVVYTGETLIEPGTYSFRMRDRMGNSVDFTVTIDEGVSYSIDGTYIETGENTFLSKNYLILNFNEPLGRFEVTSDNGVSFVAGDRVTVEGVYTVTLEDTAGNTVVLTMIIDKTAPVPVIHTETGDTVTLNGRTQKKFRVSCAETDAVVTYSADGTFKPYSGELIAEPGTYSFRIRDVAGNESAFEVTIDRTIDYTVSGVYVENNGQIISKNYLTIDPGEELARFNVQSDNGVSFVAGERVTVEGVYTVTLEDLAGNIVVLTLVIDKTPPAQTIRTENGTELAPGTKTNGAFIVTFDEEAVVSYSIDNGAAIAYAGTTLREPGEYRFSTRDIAGNLAEFTVTIDYIVAFSIGGTYLETGENAFLSKNYLVLEPQEPLKRVETESANGIKVIAGQKVAEEGTYRVTIEDEAGNIAVLTFMIDKTAPVPVIRTEDGAELMENAVTNRAFSVVCAEEGAAIRYMLNNGAYTEYSGLLLSEEGEYGFELKDRIGNVRTFTVTVRKNISFVFSGNYIVEGENRYVSRTGIAIQATGTLSRFEVVSDNGVSFAAGETVTAEGTYTVTLEDDAGNVAVVTLVIDKTPPEPEIRTESGAALASGGSTRESFTVTCGEAGAVMTYSMSGYDYTEYDGRLLTETGTYYFRLRDAVGNERACEVKIDRDVKFTVGGVYVEKDGRFVSKTYLTVDPGEALPRFEVVSDNGVTFTAGERLTEEGTYTATLEDLAGNTVVLTLVVDKTPPVPVIRTESGGTIEQNGKTQENYTVTCAEADAVITFSVDGTYQPYGGQPITEIGTYSFRIRDAVGNILNFDVTIDREIKFSVDGASVVNEARYLSKNYLVIDAGEELSRFGVASANGVSFVAGEKVTVEGVYTVTLGDAAGNTVVLTLVIDKTAPEPVIRTEDGFNVAPDSAVPKSFRVTCKETDVIITYSVDGTYRPYNGELLTEPGTYTFRLRDTVGNERHFDVTIDSRVKYTLGGTYIERDGRIVSKSWLSIEGGETLARFELRSAGGVSYAAGERLTEEGTYTATLEDVAGNVVVLTLEIDKTAPVPVIRTEEGVDVAPDSAVSKSFCVTCEEAGASVSVLIGGLYKPYGGELLIEPETYAFRLRDAVGNEREFYVTIDNTLKYTLEGTYIEPGNGRLVSKSGLTIVAGETFSRFEVVSDNGKTFVAGEKVTAEGTYTVTIGDAAGNVVVLTLEIDKTAPEPIIRTESGIEIEPDGATGDGFRVTCAEPDTVITYSVDGTYQPYNGGLIDEGGIYTFVMRDVVGNERNFTVTVDREVLYAVGGAYVLTDDGRYLSMSWLTIDEKETLARCEITDGNGKSFEAGKKLSEEGTYTATLEDVAGNVVVLTLVVDKTPPKITLRGVGIGGVTGGNVTVTAEGFVQLLDSQGTLLRELEGETVISDHGDYRVKATDDAGNTATVEFSVDKLVEASAENLLYSGQIMTGNVGFTFAEPVTLTATKDGQPFEYKRGSLKDPGSYIVSATDVVGNVRSWSFRLLPTIAKTYAIPLPEGWTAWVQRDGATVTDAVSGGQVVLTASGAYVVEFDDGKNVWQVVLTVKNTPPVVEIVHDGDYIVMKNPDDVKLTLEVMKDGKPYSYTIGETFTKNGSYVVIVTDEYGNTAQYTFEIQYLNVAGKIAIAIGCLAALALVLFLIISRLRTKVR